MKTYLLISPQPWGKMYLSKHNYAMALAAKGHRVYFLNPPHYKSIVKSFGIQVTEKFPNLFLLDYTLPSIVYTMRFKVRTLYDLYIRRTVVKHINKLGGFDELWCFEPNVFSEVNGFNAHRKLLFIVDYHDNSALKKLAKDVDGIASISNHILYYFGFAEKPKMLLHHGLNKTFANFAARKLAGNLAYSHPGTIRVAYVGNLLQGNRLDSDTMRTIIEQNPTIEFHIYGSYEEKEGSLGATINDNLRKFIQFLKSRSNVFLHGVKEQSVLAEEMQTMDAFLTCYNYLTDYNKSSNCHKVIEYLSTGRVVVANRLFAYDNLRDLVEMPDELTNEQLPALFQKVVSDLAFYNSPDKQKLRITFALENTYDRHIATLQDFLESAEALAN